MKVARRIVIALAFGVAVSLACPATAGEPVVYLRDVKPLLEDKCFSCHGGLQQKAGLRVDTVKLMLEGSDRGSVIVPGKSGDSKLIDHITGAKGAKLMPPATDGEPFPAAQVAIIRKWIDQGAQGPTDEKPEADPRDHWAFRPPQKPSLPVLKSGAASNPIDAFIAADWEKLNLKPQPAADKRLLLRRLYLDLIGLPPSRAELEAFASDASPDALVKVVDRLLASKQYGERWGRHWMDIWRYSDWWGLGQEVRNSQKHIWHWRDWIIESLNADKGYDQMVREMFAADELYPNDLDRIRATGYLVRHYFIFNRTTWLDETVEHTAKAFLGLTLNCAKCHDHKYDPIRQADYYRFRAFFEPYQVRTEQAPGETDYTKDGIPRVFDCNLTTPTYLFFRGDDRQPVKEKVLAAGLPKLLLWEPVKIEPVTLPAEAYAPGLRSHVLESHLKAAEKKIEAARIAMDLARKELAAAQKKGAPKDAPAKSASKPPTAEQAQAALEAAEHDLQAAELGPEVIRATAAADRAKFQQSQPANFKELALRAGAVQFKQALAENQAKQVRAKLDGLQGKKVTPPPKTVPDPKENYSSLRGAMKAPESNLESDAAKHLEFPRTSSGRRTALSRWLTDRRNPLTARVAVNHVWSRHFGKPLVPTVFDFGRKGAPPTHAALLDYLAVDFMENGWSMKHLHRVILTSRVFGLSSSTANADSGSRERDPENRHYWRMNPIRMDAQVLRDSLLSLAGELDAKMGGPSVAIGDESSRRRSLYFVHSNNDNQKFLSVFDDASVRECYRRSESIVPQQALALANSRLTQSMTAKINDILHQQHDKSSDTDFIRAAFEMILASPPSREEQAECEQTLLELGRLLKGRPDASRRARAALVHALLNHNDFITVR